MTCALIYIFTIISFKLNTSLQGDFTYWNNGTALTHTFWFEPDMHRIKNITRTLHILSTDAVMTPESGPKTWRDIKQPAPSLKRNCTIVVIDSDPKLYMKWYVVPCNYTFAATYICQPPVHQPYTESVKLQNPHLGCEENWFGLVNHSKCYMMIKSPATLTFDAALRSCSMMSSSLLNVFAHSSAGTLEDIKRMGYLMSYTKMKIVDMHWKIWDFYDNRKALDHTHPLLSLIKLCSKYLLTNIRILVSVNERCARAEYLNLPFGGSRRWTSVFCSVYTPPTDVFICEKPSVIRTSITCDTEYYQCKDATCILSLYVCDTVEDCLGGEDETQCVPVVLQEAVFSFQNNILHLPCLIYHNCNDSLESMIPPVKLHTICDGLMSHVITLNEDDMCIKRRVDNINLRQMIANTEWTYKQDAKFTDDFLELIRLIKIKQMEDEAKNKPINQSLMHSEEFKIPCHKGKYYTAFSEICHIRAYGEQCGLIGRNNICPYMVCPGMFRCVSLYCIHMSSVCDGQRDCIHGEDEASCTNLSCPGFLKCRGEFRCISPDQICDGRVDCIVSFDDEITCGYCPEFCKCDGYLLHCTVDNIPDGIITGGTYSKGVILKVNQTILSIDIFLTLSLVFIDISHCNVRLIHFAVHNHTLHQKILFGNFSVNLINDTTFFRAELLTNLVVVDTSANLISVLTSRDLQLKHLIVIYAQHNPILFIELSHGMDSLKYISLQHIKFQWGMIFKTTYLKLKTAVTDSTLCCVWNEEIHCIYNAEFEKCYGILKNKASLIALGSLTILSTSTILVVLIKILKMIIMKHKVKKYYNICLFNHIIACTFSATSLAGLFIVGMSDIHLITWRKSVGCHVINGFCSVSVGTNLAFKAFSVVIIAMKINFPFAHQCLWLKKTFVLCILIWVIYLILYTVNILVPIVQLKDLVFDTFCSVGECHVANDRMLMYTLICSVDCILLFTIFAILIKTTVLLREKNKDTMLSRKIKVFTIVFRLTKKIIPQATFAIFLYLISLFQYIDTSWKEHYCYAVFSNVFPIIIIIDCILSIY